VPRFDDHPTVLKHRLEARLRSPEGDPVRGGTLAAAEVRSLAIECGADDVGVVSLDRPELADQRTDILHAFPAATVTIRDRQLTVAPGLVGTADCAVTADAATWTGYLRKERSVVWAIMRRKVKVRGPLRLLQAFGRCFPS